MLGWIIDIDFKRIVFICILAGLIGVFLVSIYETNPILTGVASSEASLVINVLAKWIESKRKKDRELRYTAKQLSIVSVLYRGQYTIEEIAKRTGLSSGTVKKELKALAETGEVLQENSDGITEWILNEKTKKDFKELFD